MGPNRGGLKLAGYMVPRTQPRLADQRAEPRHHDLANRAILVFRGADHLVPVLNISWRGIMLESGVAPRIGERVVVQLQNRVRVQAIVRWIRDGRIGLNFDRDVPLGRSR
jgi:hypothetical protein